jgi:hypothetical protein
MRVGQPLRVCTVWITVVAVTSVLIVRPAMLDYVQRSAVVYLEGSRETQPRS